MELKEDLKQKINSLNNIKDCMTIFVKADKYESCREQMKEIISMIDTAQKLQSKFHELKPRILYESNERHQRLITEWNRIQSAAFEMHGMVEKKNTEKARERQKSPFPKKVLCNELTPNKRFLSVPNSMKTPVTALKQSSETPRMALSAYKESPLIRKIRPVSICFEDFSFKITQAMFSSIPK